MLQYLDKNKQGEEHMKVFDNMRDKLLSYFTTNEEVSSDWIKINDKLSEWTIEDFSYQDGVPEDGVENIVGNV